MASHSPPQASSLRYNDPTVYDKMTPVFATRNASNCCAYLLPHLKPTDHILDVGCGPGTITLDLARFVPQGRVVGYDLNAESLVQAREAAKVKDVENVEFLQGDAHDMSGLAKDGQFDVVHAHMVIMHLPSPVKALREMRGVVKDGGIVAIRDNAHLLFYPESPVLMKQQRIYDRMMEDKGGSRFGGKETHIWAHEAGFEWGKMRCSSGSWEYSGPQGRKVWVEGAKDSMRKMAVDGGYATDEEMDRIRDEWEDWGRREDARFMALDGQVLCWK